MKKLTLLFSILFVRCVHAQLLPVGDINPIRISGDSFTRYNASITDSNTLESIQFVRGDYVTFDVGLFDRGVFRSNTISQFTNLTIAVFAVQNDTNPPMMLQILTNGGPSWNTNCSLANWTNNSPLSDTNWNAEFFFANTLTSITLNGQTAQTYWLRLYATTTDAIPRNITYLEGPITIYDGPIQTNSPPGFAWLRYYWVGENLEPQIYDPASGHFYNIEVDTFNGVRSLSLGDTPY